MEHGSNGALHSVKLEPRLVPLPHKSAASAPARTNGPMVRMYVPST